MKRNWKWTDTCTPGPFFDWLHVYTELTVLFAWPTGNGRCLEYGWYTVCHLRTLIYSPGYKAFYFSNIFKLFFKRCCVCALFSLCRCGTARPIIRSLMVRNERALVVAPTPHSAQANRTKRTRTIFSAGRSYFFLPVCVCDLFVLLYHSNIIVFFFAPNDVWKFFGKSDVWSI